jgi:hypothetical protein
MGPTFTNVLSCCAVKDRSKLELGIPITYNLMLSELTYDNDAALPSNDTSNYKPPHQPSYAC